jgi:kynurenine formamidase
MLYDLSVAVAEGMAKIPSLPEVKIRQLTFLEKGDGLAIRELHLATHIGTHVDAPCHAIAGARSIDEIPLDHLWGPAVAVPVDVQAGEAISLDAVRQTGVPIFDRDIVLLATGWAAYLADSRYRRHPYLSEDLAQFLVDKRVKMVGIDCLTVDMPADQRPPGFSFPIHRTLLGHDVLIIENLADLSRLRGRRGTVWAFPVKIRGSDAAPARVVGDFPA